MFKKWKKYGKKISSQMEYGRETTSQSPKSINIRYLEDIALRGM